MHFCLFKNGIAREFDVYTIYGHMLSQNLSSKHPLVGQFKRLKCEQRHFFFQKWHWFAAFVDPLWLIATIEYIALCHYLWFNDDSYPVWLIATIEYIALVTRGSQEKSRIRLSVVER